MSEPETGAKPEPEPPPASDSSASPVAKPESEEDTQPMPLAEAPAEAPAVSAPAVSAPAVSAPAVSAPAVSAPAVSAPAVSAPAVSAPAVSAPATANASAEPSSSSLFDTGWDAVLAPKPGGTSVAPPDVASAKPEPPTSPPSFLPPTDKPRTSESGAVSGEFAGPDTKRDAVIAAPAVSKEATKASAAADKQAAEPVVREAAKQPPRAAEPEAGSGKLLWVLGVAAAIVLGIVWVNNTTSPESDASGSSKARPNTPNEAANTVKPEDRPKPRPPVVKTHAADPRLEALRAQEAAAAAAATSGEEQVGEDDQDDQGEQPSADPLPASDPDEPAPKRNVTDRRDPSLIPAGTPAENAKAFSKLPVSVDDGPPIGGIGRNGIHIDEILMGAGRENTECDDPTRSFSTTGTEFVNVCIRVVHSRAQDTLRVIWEQDGTVTRRGKVRIPDNLHAYKTRAYLQVRPEYVGSWRVRIVPEGEEDTDLAVAQFTIE